LWQISGFTLVVSMLVKTILLGIHYAY